MAANAFVRHIFSENASMSSTAQVYAMVKALIGEYWIVVIYIAEGCFGKISGADNCSMRSAIMMNPSDFNLATYLQRFRPFSSGSWRDLQQPKCLL